MAIIVINKLHTSKIAKKVRLGIEKWRSVKKKYDIE